MNLLESLSDNIVVDKAQCTACGICVDTCILDNLRLKLAPCRQACPLRVNCQGYVQLIARGEEAKAMELLRETLPFPGILSRICSRPCEENCHHRKMDGQAVAIRALKGYLDHRFAKDDPPLPSLQSDTNKRVAVIGSGPAGMVAAHDLRCQGHAVTVFETEAAPGGMLRWAIPEFRLPLDVLEREIELLTKMGVTIQCGIAIGKDKTIAELKNEFHALIVATGCPAPGTLNIDGENLPGVLYGLPFLHDVRAGQKPAIGQKVLVIGGGNVAVDAAQTALRLGTQDVTMVCLESDGEVPAYPEALQGALAEGVKIENAWGPGRFVSFEGVLQGVEFQRCLQVFDVDGKFSPCFDSCELMALDADTVIVAIGQARDMGFLARLHLSSEDITRTDALTLQTADEMIFLAGDVTGGSASVIEAMAKGRRAAESVKRFLSGEHLHYGRAYPGPFEMDFEIDTDRGVSRPRAEVEEHRCQGKGDFQELEKPFTQDIARREAERCYSCGQPFGKYRTCWFCLPCEVACPHEALYVQIPYLLR